MIIYIKESIQIFISNLIDISHGHEGALALVFCFAVFIVFYNIINGIKK